MVIEEKNDKLCTLSDDNKYAAIKKIYENKKLKSENLDDLLFLHRHGILTPLVQQNERQKLLALLEEWPSNVEEEKRLRLMALISEIQLVAMDRRAAARTLYPFVQIEADGQLKRGEDILEEVSRNLVNNSQLVNGLVFAQLANLFYRYLHFKEAESFGIEAARSFQRAQQQLPRNQKDGADKQLEERAIEEPYELRLAEIENRVWLGRIQLRLRKWPEVQRDMEAAVKELFSLYGELREWKEMNKRADLDLFVGRVDLVLALALTVTAALAWSQGHLDLARRRVLRAAFLLRNGRADDEIRLGQTLYLASRIEASDNKKVFDWAIELASQSEDIFDNYKHPFKYRALIQKTMCLIKAERLTEADKELTKAKDALESNQLQEFPAEKNFITGEIALAAIWVHERREEKKECCIKALELVEGGEEAHPRRHYIEGLLQAGRYLIQLSLVEAKTLMGEAKTLMGEAKTLVRLKLLTDKAFLQGDHFEIARAFIEQAGRLAQSDGRTKIAAAANLALAEGLVDRDTGTAHSCLVKARHILAGSASAYLIDWERRLAPRFEGPILIDLRGTFKEVQARFRQEYVRYYYFHTGENIQTTIDLTEMTRSTIYAELRKLQLLKEKRGRPKKKAAGKE